MCRAWSSVIADTSARARASGDFCRSIHAAHGPPAAAVALVPEGTAKAVRLKAAAKSPTTSRRGAR
jgi:hypothetical protein